MNIKSLTSNKLMLVLSFVGLFLISIGVSLFVFSLVAPKTTSRLVTAVDKSLKVNLQAPKVAECPTNGEMYTQAEADLWNTHRPITAMIENNIEARPESGLSKADVVYEAVAEGWNHKIYVCFLLRSCRTGRYSRSNSKCQSLFCKYGSRIWNRSDLFTPRRRK